jgi:N-acetylated-alpha-linked acidic dipeptidase
MACRRIRAHGIQIAIAKHIGLQVLRLSSDIILPFNTTHYSLELESYLDKYVQLTSHG